MVTTIEIRRDARGGIDEVVSKAEDLSVHLERMNDRTFALIVETRYERACFNLGAVRAEVGATLFERHSINRRAEGQRRRWRNTPRAQRKRRRPDSVSE